MEDTRCPDIDKYLFIVRQMLDHEASKEDEAFLMTHIEHCKCCLKEYQLEQQIRTLLRTKADRRKIPMDLANEIRSKIQQNLRNDR